MSVVEAKCSIEYVGDGYFMFVGADGSQQKFNLADANRFLRLQQCELWDEQIADQYQEILEANTKRKGLNALLVKMREHKEKDLDDDGSTKKGDGESFTLTGYEHVGNQDIDYWRRQFKLGNWDIEPWKDKDVRDGQWEIGIESCKNAIDEISSDTELMMIRFRSFTDKRDIAFRETRTTDSKIASTMQAINQS